MKIISREAAQVLGLKHYYTGEPCAKGHRAPRHTCNKSCVECRKLQATKWRKANRDYDVQRRRDWRARNRDRVNELERKRCRADPAIARNRALRHRYGIDDQWVRAEIAKQGGRCRVCRTEFSKRHGQHPNVDHDHVTGKVRGVICGSCNTAAGLLKDSPATAEALAAYLKAHQ